MLHWADARDFADWWLTELRALLPEAIRGRNRPATPDCVLHVARNGLQLARSDGSAIGDRLPQIGMDELQKQIKAGHGARFEIRLASDRVLQRRLASFRLPRRRARAAAELDLASSTPLDAAAVVLLFPEEETSEGTRYFVVKRDVLRPLLRAVEDAGGTVAAISLETGHGLVEVGRESFRPLRKHARRERAARGFKLAALWACFCGAVLTFAHAQWRLREGVSRLDVEIAQLEGEAKAVRVLSDRTKKQLLQIEGARARKAQAVPVARIWAELTRIIPDDSWATDLAVKDGRITFSGFAPSASALIPLLDASPLFAEPTFSGPVARGPDTPGERFTIEIALEG